MFATSSTYKKYKNIHFKPDIVGTNVLCLGRSSAWKMLHCIILTLILPEWEVRTHWQKFDDFNNSFCRDGCYFFISPECWNKIWHIKESVNLLQWDLFKWLLAVNCLCICMFVWIQISHTKSGLPSSQNNYIHTSIHCLRTYQCSITRELMDGLVPNKVASECSFFFNKISFKCH